jgi:hypothetical protein
MKVKNVFTAETKANLMAEILEGSKDSPMRIYLGEVPETKEIKKEINHLNRILAYINRINKITEDRNYWRLKCKIQIGEMHLYPEFLRLQNERREKRLPI